MSQATIYSFIDRTKLYVNFPDGGKWTREFLKEVLGSRVHLEWTVDNAGKVWWMLAKRHRENLAAALQTLYGGVWVIREYSVTQVCTHSCQGAVRDDCTCSCGGEFHGGGGTWAYVMDDLLINHEVRRVSRYYSREMVGPSASQSEQSPSGLLREDKLTS
ncbi:hypothetical protein [Arthrobacter sp. ISL-28]|uniref:hypothetical protein n=1 Tax=Arthrobacter sp. ISL-28 TaxID=2819108 RepID=UPI001BEBA41B|nr:hypothetical protein [Arthrobacter sp. ISL-28]MBT2522766.1 hypothetical protein [Arthrobacter sp. ISL-28]